MKSNKPRRAGAASALLCALGLIALTLCGLLTGLEHVFLDPGRYTALMDALNVYPDVGISREEQILINGDLADYLAGRIDSLDRPVTLRGEAVPSPFNDREKAHMVDVRRLFDTGRALRMGALIAGVLFAAAGAMLGPRRARSRGFVVAHAVVSLIGGAAAFMAPHIDFDVLFTRFHHLLFTNDLWLLDPATDAMIRMLPEAFFESMAFQGLIAALIGGAAAFALGAALIHLIPERKKDT